ncbi:ATP-dependent RNA helicase HrpB, partial [Salmonella enterica subsp. enterica serovar Javiana]
VRQALDENGGDVLAFLPGRREIARTQAMLEASLDENIDIVALHGELSMAEQQAALSPAEPGTRRVVLATNVAESSVTLPGIRAVVD